MNKISCIPFVQYKNIILLFLPALILHETWSAVKKCMHGPKNLKSIKAYTSNTCFEAVHNKHFVCMCVNTLSDKLNIAECLNSYRYTSSEK